MGRDRNFGNNRNFGANLSGGGGFNAFEPRNNRGSRSGNRAGPAMNFRVRMSRMDDDEDFTTDTYGPGKGYGSMGMGIKTPEQIAFDTEFEKWEKSFDDWKMNNRNHPDPVQYRAYEQKFLDVRSKLLKKRREIYGEGPMAGSSKTPFDSQLNAADAMANSILSKFGSAGGNSGRRNNNNFNQGGGGNNRGNSNNGGVGGNDILNNELIMTALKVISGGMGGSIGGPMGGNMGNGPSFGPMFNRGGGGYGGGYNDGPYGSGYGRGNSRGYGNDNYGRGYDNGPRNGPRRAGGDNKLGPKKPGANRDPPVQTGEKKKRKRNRAGEKKEPKELKEGEFDSRTPFLDRVPAMYEEARNADLPKLLSGAGTRRLRILKDKETASGILSDREKLFMEYAEYVFKKREEYYKLHPEEDKRKKTEDVVMEDKAEVKPVEAPAAAPVEAPAEAPAAAKVDDVEMNEDELLKD